MAFTIPRVQSLVNQRKVDVSDFEGQGGPFERSNAAISVGRDSNGGLCRYRLTPERSNNGIDSAGND